MARSNSLENSWLKLILQNVSITNLATASGVTNLYVALYTTDPTDADSGVEANYTSYARVAVARTTGGWTVSNNIGTNAATITFPQSTGGTNTITHVGIRTASSGGDLLWHGNIDASVTINSGDTPKFNAGEITITAN